jgi:hypothetical protein
LVALCCIACTLSLAGCVDLAAGIIGERGRSYHVTGTLVESDGKTPHGLALIKVLHCHESPNFLTLTRNRTDNSGQFEVSESRLGTSRMPELIYIYTPTLNGWCEIVIPVRGEWVKHDVIHLPPVSIPANPVIVGPVDKP